MGGINVKRWILGGVVAGIIIWVLEGVAGMFFMADLQASLEAAGLSMEMSAGLFLITVVVCLITGLVAVFFYAAARPRFGPGPRTAILIAVPLYLAGYFLSLIGYDMIGLYPRSMLVTWGCVGLVEIIAATLIGAWIYRED